MKKTLLLLTLATLATALTLGAGAACGSNFSVTNAAQVFATGLSATPANVHTRMWISGSPAIFFNTMTTAAIAAPTCSEFDTTHMTYETTGCGLPGYLVLTDWLYPAFAGCPGGSSRLIIVMEDTTGNFVLGSLTGSGSDFSLLDTIPTIAAANKPITSSTVTGGGTGATLVWPALASDQGSYPGGDAPVGAVITGVNIYYKVASDASAPADLSLATGGWTLATGGSGLAYTSTGAAVSGWGAAPGAGNAVWVMKHYSLRDGFNALYGGTPRMAVGPTAAGVFASFGASSSGRTINVNWTSNVETGVVEYQAYTSSTLTGSYRAQGSPVAPAGDGRAYSTSFLAPGLTSQGVVFVKVGAKKLDGTVTYTDAKKVAYGSTTTIPNTTLPN